MPKQSYAQSIVGRLPPGFEDVESLLHVAKVETDRAGPQGMGLLGQSSWRDTSCVNTGAGTSSSLVLSGNSCETPAVPPTQPQTVPGARSGQQAVTATTKDAAEGFDTADILALLTMAHHLHLSPG